MTAGLEELSFPLQSSELFYHRKGRYLIPYDHNQPPYIISRETGREILSPLPLH